MKTERKSYVFAVLLWMLRLMRVLPIIFAVVKLVMSPAINSAHQDINGTRFHLRAPPRLCVCAPKTSPSSSKQGQCFLLIHIHVNKSKSISIENGSKKKQNFCYFVK